MPMGRSSGHDSGTFQAMKRRYRRVKDNHGRLFGFPVEGPDGHACGPVEFIAVDAKGNHVATRPPILPPPAYFQMFTDAEGTLHLTVNYPKWKADVRREWEDFTKAVRDQYSRINLECDWSPTGTVGMRGDVRDKVGPDPSPIEPVLACEQGNRWALYGEGECPPKLRRFIAVMAKTGSVLGERENITFEDDPPEPELAPIAEGGTEAVEAAADLDDEFEAKGMGPGVEPVHPTKSAKTNPNAWPAFLAEAMQQRGLTMAEAAREWRDLKGRRKTTV